SNASARARHPVDPLDTTTPYPTTNPPPTPPPCAPSSPPNHKTCRKQHSPRPIRHDPNTHALLRSPISKAPQQPQLQPAPNNRPIHKRGSSTEAGQSGCADLAVRL